MCYVCAFDICYLALKNENNNNPPSSVNSYLSLCIFTYYFTNDSKGVIFI